MDEAARELALVRKAICSGLSNCYDWYDDKVAARVRSDASLQGLQPQYIKTRLYQYVAEENGKIDQRREQRPEYSDRDYWYRVCIPEDGFPRGIFVEIILENPDDECPVVALVNAHAQRS